MTAKICFPICALTAAFALLPSFLFADDPKPKRTWNLTTYLHGTSDQIRTTLNKEPEIACSRWFAANDEITQNTDKIEARKKAILVELQANPAYKQALQDKTDGEADWARAKAADNIQGRVDASSKTNHAKQIMATMETTALTKDEKLIDYQRKIAEAKKDKDESEKSFWQAMEWRETISDALETTVKMEWPLTRGKTGILGPVKIESIVGRSSITALAQVYEDISDTGKDQEGIKVRNKVIHKVKFQIEGIDLGSKKEGDTLLLRYNFVVKGTKDASDFDRIYIVEPQPADIDDLCSAVFSLPDKFKKMMSSTMCPPSTQPASETKAPENKPPDNRPPEMRGPGNPPRRPFRQ